MNILHFELSEISGIAETLRNRNVVVHKAPIGSPETIFDDIASGMKYANKADAIIISETGELGIRLTRSILNDLNRIDPSKPVLVFNGPLSPGEELKIAQSGEEVAVFSLLPAQNGCFSIVRAELEQALDYLSGAAVHADQNVISIAENQGQDFFRLHPETQNVYFADHHVKLTPTSKKLMTVFIAAAGEVISRDQLHRALGRKVRPDSISTYVSDLRKELASDLAATGHSFRATVIETVGHDGWRLRADSTASLIEESGVEAFKKAPKTFSFHGLSFTDNGEDGVYFHHNRLRLTETKRKLFVALLKARGKPLTLAALHQAVYGAVQGDKSYDLWQHISGLRRQLQALGFGRQFIETIRNGEHKGKYRIAVGDIPPLDHSAKVTPLAYFRERRLKTRTGASLPKLART